MSEGFMRGLDIGPGPIERVPGFETFDKVAGPLVDMVGDCRDMHMYIDGQFDVVHASHVLEHVDWWDVKRTLAEWVRITAKGGSLEVWFPDGQKLMWAALDWGNSESMTHMNSEMLKDSGYQRDKHKGDPYLWAMGRLLNHPMDGNEYQRHRSILTKPFVARCMKALGLETRWAQTTDRRGWDHGWINAGVIGVKR